LPPQLTCDSIRKIIERNLLEHWLNSTNSNTDSPEDESKNHEVQKTGDNKELNSIKFVLDIEAGVTKKNESYTHTVDTEVVATGLNLSLNTNNMHAPYSSKNSQLYSPFSSTKPNEKNYDAEGN
jgi:hypothetical protein